MEKFGLDALRDRKLSALEQEIAKGKASALGIAGKKLDQLLAQFRLNTERGDSRDQAELIAKIADNLSEFLIQRELAGVPHENLEWILKTCDIPEEILARLGLRRGE